MLTELRIRNFALIEDMKLDFGPGLSIISGETGAGKSIIVQAIQLVLGSKGGSHLIRTGAGEARVEAFFDCCSEGGLAKKLEDLGIDAVEGIIVVRTLSRSGKNRVFANGLPTTLNIATQIAGEIISIAGQHEYQSLMRPQNHLLMLDSFGGLIECRESMAEAYRKWQFLVREHNRRVELQASELEKKELMVFQLAEIEKADLKVQEEEELQAEKAVLASAERLKEWSADSYGLLYASSGAVMDNLSQARNAIRSISSVDKNMTPVLESVDTAYFQIEDASLRLRDYLNKIVVDPRRLEFIEERLQQISRLKKKYGSDVEGICLLGEKLRETMKRLDEGQEETAGLESSIAEARREMIALAESLSKKRRATAEQLSGRVSKALESLHMPRTEFVVEFRTGDNGSQTVSEYGVDLVQFLISPNPGEMPKPLSQIASGGELSRITLVLKSLLTYGERVESVIFDEIDSGISGAVAEVVGLKLKELSRGQQVISITHLPQIACFADRHYRVTKEQTEKHTEIRVEELQKENRVEEIARMLGGVKISDTTRAHAREMIARSLSDVGGRQ